MLEVKEKTATVRNPYKIENRIKGMSQKDKVVSQKTSEWRGAGCFFYGEISKRG
jgi:hypothetical protein